MIKVRLVFAEESKETQAEVIASVLRDIETCKRCYYKAIAQGRNATNFENDINSQLQWLEDNADSELVKQILSK